jgi:hypothetical protein
MFPVRIKKQKMSARAGEGHFILLHNDEENKKYSRIIMSNEKWR